MPLSPTTVSGLPQSKYVYEGLFIKGRVDVEVASLPPPTLEGSSGSISTTEFNNEDFSKVEGSFNEKIDRSTAAVSEAVERSKAGVRVVVFDSPFGEPKMKSTKPWRTGPYTLFTEEKKGIHV